MARLEPWCIFAWEPAGRHAGFAVRDAKELFGRTVYYSTISLFHFLLVPGRRFLHLEPPPLHVAPPFSPVGRTVYYLTVVYYFIFIGFQARGFAFRAATHPCMSALGCFACWAVNPTRPPHPSISQRFFCISDRQPCMSALVFACQPNVSLFASASAKRRLEQVDEDLTTPPPSSLEAHPSPP